MTTRGDDAANLFGQRMRVFAVVAGIAAVAINLRPGITTVGPELTAITDGFGAGDRAAGVITAVPVVAFAVIGLVTPLISQRIGLRSGLYVALAVLGTSLAVRPWGGLGGFIAATFTAALGFGLITVLLPALIRSLGNPRTLSATFTTALQAGAALGFATVVPLSNALGSWRWALAIWAVPAVFGLIGVWRLRSVAAEPQVSEGLAGNGVGNPFDVLRRNAAVGLAIFFGLQALVAFVVMGWLPSVLRDAGVPAATAGGYLGVLTCTAVPVSMVVPPIVARSPHQGRWLAGFSLCATLGILGFLLAPAAVPLLWSLVLGLGLSVFSLALTVITTSARTPDQAVHLSSAVQGLGYLIAATGPYAMGLARGLDHGWSVPLGALIAVTLVQAAFGLAIDRSAGSENAAGPENEYANDLGRR